jgi:translocation and assembly module TamB
VIQASDRKARPSRKRRALRISLWTIALIVLAVAGAIAFLMSEAGLPFIIARIVGQGGGHLVIEEPSGSLGSTMRFKRIAWRSDDLAVEANDVVVEFDPSVLISWRLRIRGLGAQRVSIEIKPSEGATTPPVDLRPPIALSIDELDVATLEWTTGPRSGRITGLVVGYEGDARMHRIRKLALVSDLGRLRGEGTLAAVAPLTLAAKVAIDGDGPLAGARADAAVDGTLPAFALDVNGQWKDATLAGKLQVTPFATLPLDRANIALRDVDISVLGEALPRTRATLALDFRQVASGFEGTVDAKNEAPGPIDRARVPVESAKASFALGGDALALRDLEVRIAGGGRAAGSAEILRLDQPQPQSRVSLSIANVDLSQVHTRLRRTRLNGTLAANVEKSRQTISGDLSDAALRVAFSATLADNVLEVSRLTARAEGSIVDGTGRITLTGSRPFDAKLRAEHLDPSRFGAFPQGTIDATLAAKGVLEPEWSIEGDATIAPGSKLRGLALAASAHGKVNPHAARDVVMDVSIASARLTARGNMGAVGDHLDVELNAPRLADIAPFAPEQAHPLAGSLRASGSIRAEPGGLGGDVRAHGERLAAGPAFEAASLDVDASFAPGGKAQQPVPLEQRTLRLVASATNAHYGARRLASARIDVAGTFSQHKATLAARADDIDASAALEGSLTDIHGAARWKGTVTSLSNKTAPVFTLRAPASLEVAEHYVHVASASADIADGHIEVADLTYDRGRISTRGSFTDVALAAAATLVEVKLPTASTLTFDGEWNVQAAPRLNGTFAIRRARGDLFGTEEMSDAQRGLGFGIQRLEVSGTLHDDALAARGLLTSARLGSASATLSLGSVAGASEGRISPDAPLALSLEADIASLRPLQPWLGTNAVLDGRARIAVAARGTAGAPSWSGTLTGDDLRIDAVAYGISLHDGRVRAHLAERNIVLDELLFAGGDGRFVASGTLGGALVRGGESTRIAWKAEHFRVLNRPDLRIVAGGEGTLAIAERKVSLAGRVTIEQGHIEYDPAPPGRLGADVKVKGWAPPEERENLLAEVPLTLDLDVDLGRDLTFEGEGLDTGLRGRVKITTGGDGSLRGEGTIRAVNGTYYAFGQKLTIDRGQLIFDGALANPALDVVALRKNLAVEAGVELTGTVKVPRVTITSNPPVPQNEALAWLVTGQGLSGSTRTDYAAVGAASAALLSRGGKPVTTQIAQSIGLDDISVQSSGTTGVSGATNQVVVFGKRITDRLTLGYEQGLSLASGALRLEYALSRTLTLRAEAGSVSGVGIYFRRAFE